MTIELALSLLGLLFGGGALGGAIIGLVRLGGAIQKYRQMEIDLANLVTRVGGLNVTGAAADAAAGVLKSSTTALDNSFNNIHARCNELASENARTRTHVESLGEGLKLRLKQWDKAEEQLADAVGSITSVRVKVETLEKNFDKLESRGNDAAERLSALEAGMTAIRAACDRQHTGARK